MGQPEGSPDARKYPAKVSLSKTLHTLVRGRTPLGSCTSVCAAEEYDREQMMNLQPRA